MTRDELLEALLVERYLPTRPEAIGGWPVEPMRVDDSEITVARRRRDLAVATEDFEAPNSSYNPDRWRAATKMKEAT